RSKRDWSSDVCSSDLSYLLTMEGQSLIAPSTVLIRRSTLDAIGGFQYVPGICLTDAPTFVRLSMKGEFHYVPSVMGHRRRHLNRSEEHTSELQSRFDL